MKILDFRRVVDLNDYFRLYEDFLKSECGKSKAKAIIAKTKTSLVRFRGCFKSRLIGKKAHSV